MQGPSIIIKSSVAALMLHSVDGPLSQFPIHQHLGRLAKLNPSAVLSKQMSDPVQRIGFEIESLCEQRCPLFQQDGGKCRVPESQILKPLSGSSGGQYRDMV